MSDRFVTGTGADSTKQLCIAALKFRFKQTEGLDFKFPKLSKQPKLVRPHRYFNEVQLAQIFKLAEERLDIDVLVHILYDMGARIEDLVGLTAGNLQ